MAATQREIIVDMQANARDAPRISGGRSAISQGQRLDYPSTLEAQGKPFSKSIHSSSSLGSNKAHISSLDRHRQSRDLQWRGGIDQPLIANQTNGLQRQQANHGRGNSKSSTNTSINKSEKDSQSEKSAHVFKGFANNLTGGHLQKLSKKSKTDKRNQIQSTRGGSYVQAVSWQERQVNSQDLSLNPELTWDFKQENRFDSSPSVICCWRPLSIRHGDTYTTPNRVFSPNTATFIQEIFSEKFAERSEKINDNHFHGDTSKETSLSAENESAVNAGRSSPIEPEHSSNHQMSIASRKDRGYAMAAQYQRCKDEDPSKKAAELWQKHRPSPSVLVQVSTFPGRST
jgi:hypothetical protein